eukprot:gene16164-21976_t
MLQKTAASRAHNVNNNTDDSSRYFVASKSAQFSSANNVKNVSLALVTLAIFFLILFTLHSHLELNHGKENHSVKFAATESFLFRSKIKLPTITLNNNTAIIDHKHEYELSRISQHLNYDISKITSTEKLVSPSDVTTLTNPSDPIDTSKVTGSSVTHKSQNNKVDHPLGLDTVLLIICSNRPDYLKKTLSIILKHHPGNAVPILVSQDGSSSEVTQVIQDAKMKFANTVGSIIPFIHKIHKVENKRYENGYFKLADHFKWALNEVFTSNYEVGSDSTRCNRVIILEEDLEIAPDFFEYFGSLAKLLDTDPMLLAVSAWNDNGLRSLVKDEQQLYRSDFFPGLGWMMTRAVWDELSPKWPRAYWDDWLREPAQRKGRHIIRPEVSRTLHFGVRGVSNSQYSEFLSEIRLNDKFVSFSSMDLSYLRLDKWDSYYLSKVKNAPLVTIPSFNSNSYPE